MNFRKVDLRVSTEIIQRVRNHEGNESRKNDRYVFSNRFQPVRVDIDEI